MPTQPPLASPDTRLTPVSPAALPPDPARYQKQLHALMEIGWAVSSTLNVDALLPRIMQKVTEIIKAERATFFVVDRERGELWSKSVQGGETKEIRLGIGDGIAGAVVESAESVNLVDAYDDPRFDRSWDEHNGYRTRSLLCVPIHDRNLVVIAVIQCLNKQGRRAFDAEDEELLRCISGQMAIALENAFLYEALLERNRALEEAEASARRAQKELEILYSLERLISEAADFDNLIHDVLARVCAAFQCEAAAILLVSDTHAQLFARVGAEPRPCENVELRRGRGLLTRAQFPVYRCSDQAGSIADGLLPESFGLELRESFTTPLSDARSKIGVLQLINRLEQATDEDWLLRMLTLLAGQVARGISVKRERDAFERAERLALLGHSTSAILHDLRTPMTAISGYAELMSSEDEHDLRKDYAARISRALDHIETMTQEVLAFARGRREIALQPVRIGEFVAQVREMLLPETARYGVELAIKADYDGAARFDESKIKRVIFNLARNACQAMGQGGRFTWSVQREGEQLVFECSDTGPGIPKELQGQLFASFASYGKSRGTGLGLAMASKIADAHCGRIVCVERAGPGATFRIELPL